MDRPRGVGVVGEEGEQSDTYDCAAADVVVAAVDRPSGEGEVGEEGEQSDAVEEEAAY